MASAGSALGPARRLRRSLADFAFSSPLYALTLGRQGPRQLFQLPSDTWPGDAERGAALLAGLYRFAGEAVEAAEPPWRTAVVGEPFLEELHGFEWLRDLRALGGDNARRLARTLVADWIAHHDRWDALVWRPDLLGLRIAAWIGAYEFFCASADEEFRARVFASLTRQTRHLARIAPGGHGGLAELAALKGLIIGSLALGGGQRAAGLAALERALPVQVLPDGGHVERRPDTHLAALRHLVDIRGALRAAKAEMPSTLQHAIDRMAPALRFFRHQDGRLPLFNGSGEGDRLLIDTVLAQADARGRPLRTARHSGFERVVAGRTLVLMDAGAPPPGALDHGAHAGLLSFELSVGRDRMFVNCGGHPGGGTAGAAWREALRRTAAHTTVTVGGLDNLDLVEGGGIASRPSSIQCVRQDNDGDVLIEAQHDGYRQRLGVVHQRRLWLAASGEDIRGEDILTGGPGHAFAVRFHLHPAATAELLEEDEAIRIHLPGGLAWRLTAEGGSLGVEDSIYCPDWEAPQRTRQIVVSGRTAEGDTLARWAVMRER